MIVQYFFRRFLLFFCISIFLSFFFIGAGEFFELQKSLPTLSFYEILALAALKSPETLFQILPLLLICVSLFSWVASMQKNEMLVIQNIGFFFHSFIIPFLWRGLLIGLVSVFVLHPISIFCLRTFHWQKAMLETGEKPVMQFFESGVWVRKNLPDGYMILHCQTVRSQKEPLKKLWLHFFNKDGILQKNIFAEQGLIEDNGFSLKEVDLFINGKGHQKKHAFFLPLILDFNALYVQAYKPFLQYVWSFPGSLLALNSDSVFAEKYLLVFSMLMASIVKPALLLLLLLIVAFYFCQRRFINYFAFSSLGFLVFFHFFSRILYALGKSGSLKPWIAAWMPCAVLLILVLVAIFGEAKIRKHIF